MYVIVTLESAVCMLSAFLFNRDIKGVENCTFDSWERKKLKNCSVKKCKWSVAVLLKA